MRCLDKFNKKMSLSGGSLRNENIMNSRKLLEETFSDDASFVPNIYIWRLGLKEYKNESPVGIRMYGRAYSAANGTTVKFQTLYDNPIIVGDIVYDLKNDEYLICTESFDIDSIHYKGKFTVCNWILKWQNKEGKILEYPCYDMNSTQYNSGEQSNSHFTIGSAQHMITLPSDENTIVLSTPQRFFLDKDTKNPTSFIVTQNDTTSHNYGKKGLVKLTVYEYPNNTEKDNIELGICDYIEINDNNINKNTHVCRASKVVIKYDSAIIKSGGDLKVFTGKFYDEKGNEVTNILPKWDIVCDFSDKLQVKRFGNCISIGIDDDSYIDDKFKLICSYEDSDSKVISDSVIIKIDSLL